MLSRACHSSLPAQALVVARFAGTAAAPKPASAAPAAKPAAAKPAAPPPRPGPPKLTESPMDYPKEIEHNGQTVHPILSRFAVPPVPEKEPRINPDIKRLQPTPSYEKHRVVSIFQVDDPIQEGKKKTFPWYVRWKTDPAHREWRNPQTGNWGFSDPYEMMQLKFDRKEDAIRFCKTQGFNYEVEELPPQFPPVFKQYADKIQPPAVLSKMRALGPKKARSIWAYEQPWNAHWINRYHNDYAEEKWDASRF
ncbi:hypothetical protein WA577_004309 [Blastocystis sp. JDR]